MRLSVRNQLQGKIHSITPGSVMSIVKVDLKGGHRVTSSVTKEAVGELGIKAGDRVTVLIKATEVMLGVDDEAPIRKTKKKKRKGRSR